MAAGDQDWLRAERAKLEAQLEAEAEAPPPPPQEQQLALHVLNAKHEQRVVERERREAEDYHDGYDQMVERALHDEGRRSFFYVRQACRRAAVRRCSAARLGAAQCAHTRAPSAARAA